MSASVLSVCEIYLSLVHSEMISYLFLFCFSFLIMAQDYENIKISDISDNTQGHQSLLMER